VNAIKRVACVQTSAPLRNAYKISCLQKVVYTYISYRSQRCSGASGLIVATHQNGKNCNGSKEERARSLA